MKRTCLLIAGFILGASLRVEADTVKMDAAPKVEESTSDADKAARVAAAAEADQWAAKTAKKEAAAAVAAPAAVPAKEAMPTKTAEPSAVTATPAPTAPAQAAPAVSAPVATPEPNPTPRRAGLNEMKGKLQSKSDDPKAIRMLVDGGFNVEFTFDSKTLVTNGGHHVTVDDLEYNDELILRYAGKDLYAVEIERVSKAPRPQ